MSSRVLHLVSVATMTGPADPALSLAAAQRKLAGVDASIAYDQVREGDMHRRTRQHEVPVIDALSLCTKGGWRRALRDRRLLAELARDLDVVHAHSSHDHGIAALAVRGSPALLVRSIHHPRSSARRLGQGLVFARTGGFFVPARAHADRLLANYPRIAPDRVEVVPGAVDPEVYRPGLDGAGFRDAVAIPRDAIAFGMIARFQAGRRQAVLIEAVARARQTSGLDLWLALMGKGETQAEIEAAIAEHQLGAVTRLYGFRDADLPEAIASCDATVLLKEGSDAGCRAVLQSLACGVPVIGARFPAIEDALGEPGAGWLVQGEDVEELAGRLIAFARLSPHDRAQLASTARERVLARYTEAGRVAKVGAAYARWREATRPSS